MIPNARALCAVSLGLVLVAAPAFAEHPAEHPKEHPKEHPAEHPAAIKTSPISKEALATAIASHVKAASAGAGAFVVQDTATGKTLRLVLDKVHKERLARVGKDTYFACADFTAEDGASYDLDFFMRGSSADELSLTNQSVHKKNGHARYDWVMQNGFWTKSSDD